MPSSSRCALITGGAVRIGRAIAEHLAAQGWSVAVHYRESRKEAEALVEELQRKGVRAVALAADLRDEAARSRLVPAAAEALGGLHCLINNAAAFEKDTLADFTPESWAKHIDTNLYAPCALIRDFAAYRRTLGASDESASVINLTDGIAGWSISPQFLSYSISKLGLNAMTQLLASELAPRIRINAVALGPTLPGALDKPGTFEKLQQRNMLHRVSSMGEVCAAIDFLLACPSVTGQILSLSANPHSS